MVDASGASVPRPPASLATGSVKATDTSFQQTQEFNNLNQLVSATGGPAGAQTYGYDADGHRTSVTGGGSGATYRWNELGQLTGYTDPSGSTQFEYDALSRRVSTSTNGAYGSTNTSTVWNGMQPVQDTSDVAGTTTLIRGVAGELLLEGRTSGPVTWDLLDRLGSAIAQVGDTRLGSSLNNTVQNARDALTDRAARITQVSGGSDWGVPSFSTSGWNASVGHSGERVDPVAAMGLFYSRGYDTRSGSWLSRDSWEGVLDSPASLNGYAYVESNPVTSRDLLGYRPLGRYDWADGNSCGRDSPHRGCGRSRTHGHRSRPTARQRRSRATRSSRRRHGSGTAQSRHAELHVEADGAALDGIRRRALTRSAARRRGVRGRRGNSRRGGSGGRASCRGAASGMLVLSLSGDSSGVGIRRNEAAAGSQPAASAAADTRSGNSSVNCDPEKFVEYSCHQDDWWKDATSSRALRRRSRERRPTTMSTN